jgi:hypothetical protein
MLSFPEKPSEKVAVLLLAFNRPSLTDKVLGSIGHYAPPDLYVALDGPRPGRKDDELNGAAITESVSAWEAANPATRVHRLYRKKNLGCGRGVSSAITWFFSQEEMGIVLEDDCLPNLAFFSFCERLLWQYRDAEKIMHIGGSNHLHGGITVDSTYYFSKYPQIWGWASWKRAWEKYRLEMPDLESLFSLPAFRRYYKKEIFLITGRGDLDTWDIQWIYAFLMNDGLSILPRDNFIKNLGFDNNGGTHLQAKPSWYDDTTTEIEVLVPPDSITQNQAADDYVFRTVYNPSALSRIKRKLKKLLFKKG